jgi:hypothetical protein
MKARLPAPLRWRGKMLQRDFARSASGVRRDNAALSSGCKAHPAIAPAGSNRSSYGGDEMAAAFGMLTPRPIRNPTQKPHNASVPLQYELH